MVQDGEAADIAVRFRNHDFLPRILPDHMDEIPELITEAGLEDIRLSGDVKVVDLAAQVVDAVQVLVPGEAERHPKPGCERRFTEKQIRDMAIHMNINNSDVDVCEYEGRVYLVFATGNQLTESYYAEAVFDGTMKEFLEAYF